MDTMKKPVRVAVTGPAGQIGYSLLFRIASGAMLGADQPVELRLLERAESASSARLTGTMMELEDCAFPLLEGLSAFRDPVEAFRDADYALLVGARPRAPGMERADLLEANARIFVEQGCALNASASRDVKVLVVGNPCNTNAMIAMKNAPELAARNFSALMRLDQNRAEAQLAKKLGCRVADIDRVAVWGNHSPTMAADVSFATVKGEPVAGRLDAAWLHDEFEPVVAKRGGAILAARGASSAASAASAAIDHMRDWALGSGERWVTMAVPSEGEYGVPEGMVFGFPCRTEGGVARPVADLAISEALRARIERNVAELALEAEAVKAFLPKH